MNCSTRLICIFAAVVLLGSTSGVSAADTGVPANWQAGWDNPPVAFRPLQIVHGVPASQAGPEAMTALKDLGLGGIVCNVSFDKYLVSAEHWRTMVQVVTSCRDTGLRVWIYDEEGYPSGAAGGLVLQKNPGFEALALTYDAGRADPFAIRPAYEHTHASNNYHAARRYPNVIDPGAVASFIEMTHEAYYRRLAPFFGTTIEAMFTDEPSLMAVNIGPLPEAVRSKVRVVDPLDPNLPPLPSVPWAADVARLYEQRYDQDLLAVRKSLFAGDTDADRRVRRQYWALISELLAERFYGQIQEWTGRHAVASSGHILWEETLEHHPALEGNSLKALGRMDIPGLDLLTSNPEAAIYSGWMTATLPASAALWNGHRLIMTEVSDFSELMAEKGPAALAEMCATAAWQAAFGVTEFTLYYNRAQRSPDDYRAYCTYVGRLNALLRSARLNPRVLLYYPISDVWAEYTPVAGKLTMATQSAPLQQVAGAFMDLGQRLTRKQISFALADHELLAGAQIADGRIGVGDQRFTHLVVPTGAVLPAPAQEALERFEAGGGRVLRQVRSQPLDLGPLADAYDCGLPGVANDRLVVGRFRRDGRDLVLVVNVAPKAYEGTLTARDAGQWQAADPGTGKIAPAKTDGQDRIAISLPPRAARILIGPASGK